MRESFMYGVPSACRSEKKCRLPLQVDEPEASRQALRLNQRELTSLTRAHFLGSWCSDDDGLVFASFYPNAARFGGADLLNLLMSAGNRARWIAEGVYGDDWGANTDPDGRPLALPAIEEFSGDEQP